MAITVEEARKSGYYYAVAELIDMIGDAGGVTPGAAVANQGALTITGADAAAVATSATTQLGVVITKLNALLASLRTAGVIAP